MRRVVVLAGVGGDGVFFAPVDPFGVVDCGEWFGGVFAGGAFGGSETEGRDEAFDNLFALQRGLFGCQSGEMASRLSAGMGGGLTWFRGA